MIAEDALCSSSDKKVMMSCAEGFSIQIEVASTADIVRVWAVND